MSTLVLIPVTNQKCIIDMPRSEQDKTWTPVVMPPLPPFTDGLSRQSRVYYKIKENKDNDIFNA